MITFVIMLLSYSDAGDAMYVKNSDAKERLIQSGKKEFLAYGYRQASLRRICQNAGLTTGAVYSCFANKEALFCEVVGNVVEDLKQLMQETCEQECRDSNATLDGDILVTSYLWEHKEVIMILLEGAEGTEYENTIADMEAMMARLFDTFYQQYAGERMDEELLGIIVASRIRSTFEIIKGDYTLERTLELAKQMSIYANAGFQTIIQNTINRNKEPKG